MAVSQIAAVTIAVSGVVAALWLLIKSSRGQPRVLGVIGTALILLGLLARFAYQWIAERLLGRVDTETVVSVLAALTVAGGTLTGAGLLLLTRAIVVAGWPSWTDRRGNGKSSRSGSSGQRDRVD
jgi:TctA family transporter